MAVAEKQCSVWVRGVHWHMGYLPCKKGQQWKSSKTGEKQEKCWRRSQAGEMVKKRSLLPKTGGLAGMPPTWSLTIPFLGLPSLNLLAMHTTAHSILIPELLSTSLSLLLPINHVPNYRPLFTPLQHHTSTTTDSTHTPEGRYLLVIIINITII